MTLSTDRRALLLGFGATLLVAGGVAGAAVAMTQAEARDLVTRVMADVQGAVAAGRPEATVIRDFERIFSTYGDLPVIARSVLGPSARGASARDLDAFTDAFRGYMARKYGRQFRRFTGARIDVTGAREVQRYWEVISTVNMRGEPPFDLRWHVSDRSGRNLFFNLIIDGVNLLAAERQEIGTMLERRGGNIARMTEDLRQAG